MTEPTPEAAPSQGSARPDWMKAISAFTRSDTRKAVWQLINTLVPYLGVMALMTLSVVLDWPYFVTLLLAVPAAGFSLRIFIFFHDCCHDSYFASRRANRIVGTITGILTFTPFDAWKRSHNIHHATAGDLDNRGTGDIWTMTVDEYLGASRLKRLGYRLVRNPFFLLLVVPFWLSIIAYRIPNPREGRAAMASVMLTNLALAAVVTAFALTVGWKTYLMIQVPVTLIAWSIGVWLFYVQHQYEDTYWEHAEQRSSLDAALKGSSYYKLPRWLQWFTGSIGLHHIHHLRPRIPNYHLQACQDAVPALHSVKPLTIRKSFRSAALNLWDEANGKMVGFGALRGRPRVPVGARQGGPPNI